MSGVSRRGFLQASAAAAAGAAVLGTPLAGGVAQAAERGEAGSGGTAEELSALDIASAPAGPVIVHVQDMRTGEVSVLHGTSEVVYRDPELVRRVLRATARDEA